MSFLCTNHQTCWLGCTASVRMYCLTMSRSSGDSIGWPAGCICQVTATSAVLTAILLCWCPYRAVRSGIAGAKLGIRAASAQCSERVRTFGPACHLHRPCLRSMPCLAEAFPVGELDWMFPLMVALLQYKLESACTSATTEGPCHSKANLTGCFRCFSISLKRHAPLLLRPSFTTVPFIRLLRRATSSCFRRCMWHLDYSYGTVSLRWLVIDPRLRQSLEQSIMVGGIGVARD